MLAVALSEARTRERDLLKEYHAVIYTRTQATWDRLATRGQRRLAVGAVKVMFGVAPDGRVHNVRIASNTANRSLAELGIRTVRETRFPPIPRALVAQLPDGMMPAEYTFNIYPSQ